jgi:hemoglobin-like flavoprotein
VISAYYGDTDTQPISRAAVVGPRLNSPHPEDPVRRPDDHHIAAVRDSFWLLGDVDLLSQRFDARLACMTPRAEGAFVQLFPRGAERFVTALLRAVDALGADPAPDPGADAGTQVRALAARLLSAGMQRSDFMHVGSSLQRAVRDSYSDEWTDDIDEAWTAVREWLVGALQSDQPANGGEPWAARRAVTDVEFAARLDRLAAYAG